MTVASEAALRTALRLSLDPKEDIRERLLLRQGRAIIWFKDALEPLRGLLTDVEIERLVCAVRSAAGIESLVWLCDIAGLSREEATELMRWSARALLRAAVSEAQAEQGAQGLEP
jgi:hypothetical protein